MKIVYHIGMVILFHTTTNQMFIHNIHFDFAFIFWLKMKHRHIVIK